MKVTEKDIAMYKSISDTDGLLIYEFEDKATSMMGISGLSREKFFEIACNIHKYGGTFKNDL